MREALIATAIRLIFVFLGLLLLKRLAALRPDQIRMALGCILCTLIAIQLLWNPKPVKALHWCWAGLAFSLSGLLAGICGMGGPPLVFWLMAHNGSTQKTRGFLFAVFATSIPVQIGLLSLIFGMSILWNVLIGIGFLPLVSLGTAIGLPIGNRMAKNTLRRVAYIILLFIGMMAILPAFLTSPK